VNSPQRFPNIEPEEAIRLLRNQLAQLNQLTRAPHTLDSFQFKKWRRDTRVCIGKIFGDPSPQITDFDDVSFFRRLLRADPARQAQLNVKTFSQGCVAANALLESLITELQTFGNVRDNTAPDALERVRVICKRFPLVARQLRARHDNRPTLAVEDEYDVQDLMHALLCLSFDDIRPEEWTPSYAGAASRMDFLLKPEQLVVETKKTRQTLTARQIGEQLIVDIKKYATHPDCKTLFCFVYDPENCIQNPRGIEADLSCEHHALRVEVLIAP
jgi:hypothetical protein